MAANTYRITANSRLGIACKKHNKNTKKHKELHKRRSTNKAHIGATSIQRAINQVDAEYSAIHSYNTIPCNY